ncbi:hypothetical protein QS306_16715 [Paraburkholderia bonniea]|uniref:hypothetical protein n=1 Tax=Paraburkholderia bonniea TaxID=2152891 RepID=UPI00129130C6|nr:hypothetical protein [Paraburkholderia bonniea]WJF91713.1 hypothetical protein QS306_16715 [Paraburkholderia bonniea]WJF95033.1 hypothetical protein QS308_16720 [Paraburkholderia bonniea]
MPTHEHPGGQAAFDTMLQDDIRHERRLLYRELAVLGFIALLLVARWRIFGSA